MGCGIRRRINDHVLEGAVTPPALLSSPGMLSPRLRYRPIAAEDLEDFHRLIVDEHIRRYLLDGNLFDRPWTAARIEDSQALFAARGVGLWLAREQSSDQLVGFCGFMVFSELQPEPQLLYALREPWSGRGLATEMGETCIAEARRHPGFATIYSGVDEVNAASLRVLEKLGFQRVSVVQGSFGNLHLLQLPG